jgi:hypothetical protein
MENNIKSKEAFEELKRDFQKWSGFSLESETLEEAQAEITQRAYQLECEIADYARQLDRMAKQAFFDLDKI